MEYHEEPGWHDKLTDPKQELLKRIVDEVADDARAIVPVDTHALQESIRTAVEGDVGRVGSDLDYSLYVEEGHRVAFRDPETEETVFTGEVVPPQPYLRPALFRKRGG